MWDRRPRLSIRNHRRDACVTIRLHLHLVFRAPPSAKGHPCEACFPEPSFSQMLRSWFRLALTLLCALAAALAIYTLWHISENTDFERIPDSELEFEK